MTPAANGVASRFVDSPAGIAELLLARDGAVKADEQSTPAQRLAEQLFAIRQAVLEHAEQLYRSAVARAERAREGLEEFDRQSEGALREASTLVEMARAAVRKSQSGGLYAAIGDQHAQLEKKLLEAQAAELMVLRARSDSREPCEVAWRVAANEVVHWGVVLLRVGEREALSLHVVGPRAGPRPGHEGKSPL